MLSRKKRANHYVNRIFIFTIALWFSSAINAHCTLYHPHHCFDDALDAAADLDPTNPDSQLNEELANLDRLRLDMMHLGGQGCKVKARDVASDNRLGVRLTRYERYFLEPWFGDKLDLGRVRVHWNARLNDEMKIGGWTVWVAPSAQTFGYNIYFAEQHDEGNPWQLIGLFHELMHTFQYVRMGGLTRFCQKYMDGWTNGGADYYKNWMEKEAFDNQSKFVASLQDLHSVTGEYYQYHSSNPYNRRTPYVIPGRLYTSGRQLGLRRR